MAFGEAIIYESLSKDDRADVLQNMKNGKRRDT